MGWGPTGIGIARGRRSSADTTAVPLAIAVGQCGGNVALFQRAVQSGDIEKVKDPVDGRTLYRWRSYRSVKATESSRAMEHGSSTKAAGEASMDLFNDVELDWGFEASEEPLEALKH